MYDKVLTNENCKVGVVNEVNTHHGKENTTRQAGQREARKGLMGSRHHLLVNVMHGVVEKVISSRCVNANRVRDEWYHTRFYEVIGSCNGWV